MPKSPTPNSSLIGRDHAPHHVLVDLVDEDHEAEHPHRLGEEADEERLRTTSWPPGLRRLAPCVGSRGQAVVSSSGSETSSELGHGERFCTTSDQTSACEPAAHVDGWCWSSCWGWLAVAVAVLLQRPHQATGADPHGVDRARPARPEGLRPDPTHAWLVVLFSSDTCLACQGTWEKVVLVESDAVAVQDVAFPADRDLHERYGIEAVPLVLVADAAGVVRSSFVGPAVGGRPLGQPGRAPRTRFGAGRLRPPRLRRARG